MSRRANILLLVALAAGVTYGWFGVPLFLPMISDDTEAIVEERGQPRSEVDEVRFRMLLLKRGMKHSDAEEVLGLASGTGTIGMGGSFTFASDNPSSSDYLVIYQLGHGHTLCLEYTRSGGLVAADLRSGQQVVASMREPTFSRK
jgi:hypothetical protein